MSKVFKRPMFRRGGNVGTGIMTGIVDRSMHAEDPFVGDTNQFSDPIKRYKNEASTLNTQADNNFYTPLPKEKIDPVMTTEADTKMPADLFPKPDFGEERDSAYYIDQLKKGGGEYGGMDPLTSFLLTAGPAITKATSFGDAISKLGPANQALIEQANKKAEYLRELGLTGTKMSLANQEKIAGRKYDYGVNLNDKQYSYASKMNDRLYGEKVTAKQWAKEAQNRKEDLNREDWLTEQAAIRAKASLADKKAYDLEMSNLGLENDLKKIKQQEESSIAINAAERKLDNAEDSKAIIKAASDQFIKDGDYTNRYVADRAATWNEVKSEKFETKGNLGIILSQKDLKDKAKFAKNQIKSKNGAGDGSIHYDPYSDKVYQVQKIEGEPTLVEIFEPGSSGAAQVQNEKNEESKTKLGDSETDSAYEKKETRGAGEVLEKITPKDTGFFEKPVFESIEEITAIENVPMTGKEIKEKYEINFPLNDKTVYAPTDNIYKSITN